MTYLRTNRAELWIGDLRCNGETPLTDAAGNKFTIEAQDADATWGNPVPVDVAVQRWMTDGAVASTQGHENREISFKVLVSATSSLGLAAGEAALAKRANKSILLAWVPPEGSVLAPTTVFEVWTWHLEHEFDGAREGRLARMYSVQMTAKPWVRSENWTTSPAPAVPGAPTTVQIDAGTSTVGWTGSPNAPTTSGGAIKESFTFTAPGGGVVLSLTRTGSVTGLGTTPYLMIDASTTGGTFQSFTVTIDGTSISKVAQIGTVSYWQVPAGVTSFTTLKMTASIAVPGGGPVLLVFSIADVSRTDTIGGIGSRKQLARTLDVGGSVPTSGSIHVASPSATALGTTLVYTATDDGSGYSPPLRQYRASGGTVTPDSTAVSGSHEAFVTTGSTTAIFTASVPAPQLPEATYVVVGRFIFGATASTMTTTVSAKASGYPIVQSVTGKVVNPTALAGPIWAVLGALSLPAQAIPAESGVATVISASATATASATVTLDELYLLDVTHGALTLVYAGAPTFTHLWIDSPDASARNRPAVYIGNQADRSDATSPDPNGASAVQIASIGDHDLDPDGAMMLTVTDGVNDAVVTGTFYHRWHTHAGD